jgi:hypothetical protein
LTEGHGSNSAHSIQFTEISLSIGHVQGLVLFDHDRITPFDKNLYAAPVSLLWQAATGLPTT